MACPAMSIKNSVFYGDLLILNKISNTVGEHKFQRQLHIVIKLLNNPEKDEAHSNKMYLLNGFHDRPYSSSGS